MSEPTITMTDATDPTVEQKRLVLLLNEAYVFLGMPPKALRFLRVRLDEWRSKVEQETGCNHFNEVQKFKQNKP